MNTPSAVFWFVLLPAYLAWGLYAAASRLWRARQTVKFIRHSDQAITVADPRPDLRVVGE